MEKALAGVRLRKVATVATKTPSAPVQLICDGDNYQSLMEDAYLERYHERLRHLTFATRFVSLGRDAAGSIVRAHTAHVKQLGESVRSLWERDDVLLRLSAEIDSAKTALGSEKVFVRLSSRSPKDAPFDDLIGFEKLYARELDWVLADELGVQYPKSRSSEAEITANRKRHAVHRATIAAMALRNGAEAIDVLVRSERIIDDLSSVASGRISVPFSVAVREWSDFDADAELRAFVSDGKVTAVTQYSEYHYFPWLHQCRSVVQSLVMSSLYNSVLPVLPLRNAVVDLVLVRKSTVHDPALHGAARFASDALELRVVEINPLAEFAGTGLFSWEHDRDVLLRGPFEFRIRECVPDAVPDMAPAVRAFLEAH